MSRRLLTALLLLVLVLPACGEVRGAGADGAPAAADLAADAIAALGEAGSAHYLLEMSGQVQEAGQEMPFSFTLEGDGSREAFTADGSVTFPGGSFDVGLIAGPHEFFLNLLGSWYGTDDFGLVEARAELEKEDPEAAERLREYESGELVRRYFDRVFTGEVTEGPDVDGAATWRFEGTLNAHGFVELAQELGAEAPPPEEVRVFEAIAEGVRFTFLAGRDGGLPRRAELHLEVSKDDFEGVDASELEDFPASGLRLETTLELSDFGTEIDYEAPESFEPLEKAFEGLFGGLG